KRFFLWKMGFSGAKIAPCPPYTPLGTIESSKGLRPSRALRGFFDSLKRASPRAFFASKEGLIAFNSREKRRAGRSSAELTQYYCTHVPRKDAHAV
ncbi:MAG: hypothetical protein SOT76_10730, partial [Eubacteriales bacterium]|nr:hypothetical protein [Eubacteriales bacterium]